MNTWTASFEDGWYPRVSPDGKYVLVGSGTGRILDAVTKQIFPIAGGYSCGWMNSTQAAYSTAAHGPFGLFRVDAPLFTNHVRIGPSLNFFGAGGNVWAGGDTVEIWSGDPRGNQRNIAEGYAATCDETGTVAYTIDVHTSAKIVVWKNGQILRTIIPAFTPSRVICGAGGYVGYGYYGPSWLNTPDNKNIEVGVTPDRHESPPLAFRHNGAVWLATTSDNGIYLRPLGVRDRAIVIPHGAVDCSVVSVESHFVVASCDEKGKLTIAEVPADAALVPIPPAKPVVAKFNDPMWVGCFFSQSIRYGSDPLAPGPCSVIVESGLRPTTKVVITRSLIGEYRDRWSQVIAIFVTSEDGQLSTEAQLAKMEMERLGLPRRDVLSYTGPSTILSSEVDIVGVECYQGNEPLEWAVSRWKSQAAKSGDNVVLICGAYSRSGMLTEDQIVAAQPKYVELARALGSKCWGILYFSWKRPGGAYYYPPVQDWIRAVVDAAPVPSPLPPLRPRVTITSYSPKLVRLGTRVRAVRALSGGPADRLIWLYRKKGSTKWIVAAINNPSDDDHHYKFPSTGTWEISAKVEGPGGSDQTTSQRLVTVT